MRGLFVAITFWTIAAPASAADPPMVRLDLKSGTSVDGAWDAGNLTFACEFGTLSIDPHQVKSLTLGEPGQDAVEIAGLDHRFRGTAKIDDIVVAGTKYQRADVLSLKHIRGGPLNIFRDILMPLVTLTAMEIVLGIDNIIFLAIVAGRLPRPQQPKARRLGLLAALGTRLMLLATLSFILGLTVPLFTLPDLPFMHDLEARQISWRDIILLAGGLFLIGKSTYEIHSKLEKPDEESHAVRAGSAASFGMVLIEIAVIDIVFSLDSVVTAIGMAESLAVMVAAMIVAVGVMMFFAETISKFVARHPTLKILALAFLILIGVLLVAEGLGQHIDKGYVYFAMAFSVVVEGVNLRMRKRAESQRLSGSDLPMGIS